MVDVRNITFSTKTLDLGLDKSADIVYNTDMLKITTNKENEMKNIVFCAKELGWFLLWGSMILFAAFGGTAILLKNL